MYHIQSEIVAMQPPSESLIFLFLYDFRTLTSGSFSFLKQVSLHTSISPSCLSRLLAVSLLFFCRLLWMYNVKFSFWFCLYNNKRLKYYLVVSITNINDEKLWNQGWEVVNLLLLIFKIFSSEFTKVLLNHEESARVRY